MLTDAHYARAIRPEALDLLTGGSATVLAEAEAAARAVIEAHLRHRYDTAAALQPVAPATLDPQLAAVWVALSLAHLQARGLPPNLEPPARSAATADALAWLEAVADGRIDPGFAPRTDGDPPSPAPVLPGGSRPPLAWHDR